MNDVKFSTLDNIFIKTFHATGKNIFTVFYTIKGLTAGDEIAIL